MAEVRVVNVTRVLLSPASGTRPEPLRLSPLDIYWIPLPPVQQLLLYETDRPLPFIAEQLRASLHRTLPRFHLLAGRFTHVPDSGDIVISFSGNSDDGVDFLQAEAEGLDLQRLADEEDHDVEAFSSLVPPLDVGELPAPVFSVQVTGFPGAGVAVGFSVHHMAVDGRAVWQFVEAWTAECRGCAARGGGGAAEPVLDRSVIEHPGAEDIARRFVRTLAPNLPKVIIPRVLKKNPTGKVPGSTLSQPRVDPQISDPSMPSPAPQRQLPRRTFVISAASIAALRDRVASVATKRPSAFVALSAHIWQTLLRVKAIPPDDQTVYLRFLMDLRRHLEPPVEDPYFGNCIRPCIVKAKAEDLLGGEEGLRTACAAIRSTIEECRTELLGDCGGWIEKFKRQPMSLATVVASPRFRVYEADFGWGRPRRAELVSMNLDGQVVLTGARAEEEAVQASVALSPLHMDGFASLFLAGLQDP